jgi:hypothetical protein
MFTESPPAFLHRLVRGRKRRRDLELADMGTAFALDQAFDEGTMGGDAAKPSARWSWRSWLGRKSGT